MRQRNAQKTARGFTIVELLIVVVVIAILATLAIVAYNGIQARARAAAVSTALNQANKKIRMYQVDNNAFPTLLADAGISDGSVTYQYTGSAGSFCVTGTQGDTSMYMSDTQSSPVSGGCPGHGQGGVAAITNLSVNPRAQAGGGGWSSNNGAILTCSTGNAVAGHPLGIVTATKCNPIVTTSSSIMSLYNIDSLGNTATVRWVGVWVWASAAGYKAYTGNGAPVNLPAATWTFIRAGSAAAGWSGAYVQTQSGAAAPMTDYAMATGVISVAGPGPYNYADGSSSNWVWNGTVNRSTSTGPPL